MGKKREKRQRERERRRLEGWGRERRKGEKSPDFRFRSEKLSPIKPFLCVKFKKKKKENYTNECYQVPSLWERRLRLRAGPTLSILQSPVQTPIPSSISEPLRNYGKLPLLMTYSMSNTVRNTLLVGPISFPNKPMWYQLFSSAFSRREMRGVERVGQLSSGTCTASNLVAGTSLSLYPEVPILTQY